jgi:LysR family hydrogen peroxide-inducible transcriptional activator
MVASGAGITLLPESAIAVEIRRGGGVVSLPFYKSKPFRTLALVWRESSPRTEEYTLLADSLR